MQIEIYHLSSTMSRSSEILYFWATCTTELGCGSDLLQPKRERAVRKITVSSVKALPVALPLVPLFLRSPAPPFSELAMRRMLPPLRRPAVVNGSGCSRDGLIGTTRATTRICGNDSPCVRIAIGKRRSLRRRKEGMPRVRNRYDFLVSFV